jgi:hypothetical protein
MYLLCLDPLWPSSGSWKCSCKCRRSGFENKIIQFTSHRRRQHVKREHRVLEKTSRAGPGSKPTKTFHRLKVLQPLCRCFFLTGLHQGCQMVCFQTKNPNLGKFWRVLLWKILVCFMTIWSILRPLELFDGHLVYLMVFWYILPRFGIFVPRKIWQPRPSQFVSYSDVKDCLLKM